MYIISTILYALIPTTCRPAEFIDQLDPSSPFYNQIKDILVGDDLNIFGSCPSYHNY
jgi:hypothetical protein